MIQIKQAVIVEGKYDKIKVSNILDTLIIETDGFGIFKDKNKQKLIRRLAETRGIHILVRMTGKALCMIFTGIFCLVRRRRNMI